MRSAIRVRYGLRHAQAIFGIFFLALIIDRRLGDLVLEKSLWLYRDSLCPGDGG